MQIKAALALATALFAVFLSGPGLTNNSDISRSYSATAVHGVPGQPETFGTIVKSGANLRLEFEQDGRKVIQILLPAIGAMYVLDPQTKTYVEILGAAVPSASTDAYVSPCENQPQGGICQKIGTDVVSGIQVERWLLSSQQQSEPLVILWDSTRRRALHQIFPDGGTMTMVFKAMEDINGRPSEHWTMELILPGQDMQTGDWWFDPLLRVVVREDLPGGETRSLQDIRVGPVEPSVFEIPEGWAKQQAPPIQLPQNSTPPVPTSE